MHEDSNYPWFANPEMKDRLEHAGFRYAHLVGIVDLSEFVSPSILEADALSFPHFRRTTSTSGGEVVPVWDDDESTHFVHHLTGIAPEICRRWMDYDWRK